MKTLCILGPTAVGKSSCAVALAERIDGEIVSVDSRKAYKRIDIGTAKPPQPAMKRIQHHLIDILDLREKNDAERFSRLAENAMADISGRKRVPILVGGSGLYFRALFHGFFAAELDTTDRSRFAESIEHTETAALHLRLASIDRESARRIHPNDRYRIMRALEVYELTGVTLSEHFRRQREASGRKHVNQRIMGLELPRDRLYERINDRTRRMMEGGWVEEVERLLAEGADPAWPGLKTLGYPEVIAFVRGRITLAEAIERISRFTRRYAKRQMTWFRKVEGVMWFNAGEADLVERMLDWVRAMD